ncbi:hypothetical protein KY321_02325 [Candidatus Woesearchaeota archaeon]|nr:hypothetical protein [Candidatus Woesearchaeota archaeon]
MDNELRSTSDVYKNFGLINTSVSENKLPDDVRFFQKIILTKEEKSKLYINPSFLMGTLIHDAAQSMLTKNIPITDVMPILEKKVKSYKAKDEKDKAKVELIAKQAESIIKNFVGEVLKLDAGTFKAETEYTHWDNHIETFFRCFVDLEGKDYFFDFKNLFGSVRKNKSGYAISKRKIDSHIYTSDLMQIALYSRCVNKKPCLIYATEDEVMAFHEDNTPELRKDNLIKYYDELILYQKIWENKLRYADGDIKKLASIIKTDFSSIRKQDFWWQDIPKEYLDRLYKYYGK